jgi:predicted metal-dependent HD superfamily phosphohydrolase
MQNKTKNEIRSRWDYFCGKLWAKNRDKVFRSLDVHYSDSHRFYHNWDHILDCLRKHDEYIKYTDGLDVITEAAIWFHDVIYDTKKQDNEKRSANFFVEACKDFDTEELNISAVANAIRGTKTHESTCLVSNQVLYDIDLSILGADKADFNQYDWEIRQEYAWVPDPMFNPKRAEVLSKFLERDKIYQTDYFQSRYEEQARKNLTEAIKKYGP